MATTTELVTEAPTRIVASSSNTSPLKLDGTDAAYGDWRDELIRDGFAVVKGAVPRDRADKYAGAMYSWLESL